MMVTRPKSFFGRRCLDWRCRMQRLDPATFSQGVQLWQHLGRDDLDAGSDGGEERFGAHFNSAGEGSAFANLAERTSAKVSLIACCVCAFQSASAALNAESIASLVSLATSQSMRVLSR